MDEDLIAYLEKKIKALEAERDHWKANHDNQVKLKHEITQRPSRFVEMVNEIESLKKQLAVTPHWVPIANFKAVEDEFYFVFGYQSGSLTPYKYQCRFNGIAWFWQGLAVDVTHVLVGLNPPASNEDPRGDGDLLPESERLDRLTRECMRDELAASANGIEAAMRRRLMEPFLGGDAERLGATKYRLRKCERWECKGDLESESEWDPILDHDPFWFNENQYRLAKGD